LAEPALGLPPPKFVALLVLVPALPALLVLSALVVKRFTDGPGHAG
jgi:hypothetical protein